MSKTLIVKMPNGERYSLQAHIIADNRACYFAKDAPESERGIIYKEEYNYTLEDDYELKDWASNNMNWEDVSQFASNMGVEKMDEGDFQEGWVNGEKKVMRL